MLARSVEYARSVVVMVDRPVTPVSGPVLYEPFCWKNKKPSRKYWRNVPVIRNKEEIRKKALSLSF